MTGVLPVNGFNHDVTLDAPGLGDESYWATLCAEADEAAQAAATGPRSLRLVAASAIRMRRVRWFWDDTPADEPPTSRARIPAGTLHLVGGHPGIGKSQFAIWLIAQVTGGTLPGEYFGRPRPAVIAASEDSWAMTIVPRLVAAGADLHQVYRVDVVDEGDRHARLSLPADLRSLGDLAESIDLGVLVCDPLLSVIDAKIDDYRATDVRKALEPLVALADKTNLTVIGLAHFTKTGGSDPLSRFAGSGAFGQVIRSASALTRREGAGPSRFVLSSAKNNLGNSDLPSYDYTIESVTVATDDDGDAYTSRFVLGGHSDTTVVEEMRQAGATTEERSTTEECMEWLHAHLVDNGGEASRTDILKAARSAGGYADRTVERAKEKLKITSKLSGFGRAKTSLWSLPR